MPRRRRARAGARYSACDAGGGEGGQMSEGRVPLLWWGASRIGGEARNDTLVERIETEPGGVI